MLTHATSYFPGLESDLIAGLNSANHCEAARAVDEVCAQYYYPLYCYIRRRGLDHHDSQDVLHDFFAKLLRTNALAAVDARKGSLRGLLAVSLDRHLINWRHKHRVHEREVSLDEEAALSEFEACGLRERLRENETPARTLERIWAQNLLGQVLHRLGLSYSQRGKAALFKVLKPVLLGGGSLRGEDTLALARNLGVSEGTLRVSLCRLLQDYREVLEREVRKVLIHPGEMRDELNSLRRLFAGG